MTSEPLGIFLDIFYSLISKKIRQFYIPGMNLKLFSIHCIEMEQTPKRTGLEQELFAFDTKNKNPLPPILQKWRERWVKAIEKENKKRYM